MSNTLFISYMVSDSGELHRLDIWACNTGRFVSVQFFQLV